MLNSRTQSESTRLHRDFWEHGLFIGAHSAHLFKLFYSFIGIWMFHLDFWFREAHFSRLRICQSQACRLPLPSMMKKTARWINHLAWEIQTRQQQLVLLPATLLSISAGAATITTSASCLCHRWARSSKKMHKKSTGSMLVEANQPVNSLEKQAPLSALSQRGRAEHQI